MANTEKRKKNSKYYDCFVEMAEYSCNAAIYLKEILVDFNPDNLQEQMEKMHAIEHGGDVARHGMSRLLAKEFITPIEPEDILQMAEAIDTVTDKIEDVLLRLYMFDIREIREDAIVIADVIVKCAIAMKESLKEMHNFRKSKTINDLIIEINRLEEEGDRLYQVGVRNVYTDENISPKGISAWNMVFDYLEDVCDACEDVADVIEGVMMKNT